MCGSLLDVQELNKSREASQIWGMCLVGSKYCVSGDMGVKGLWFGLEDMEGEQWGTRLERGGRNN